MVVTDVLVQYVVQYSMYGAKTDLGGNDGRRGERKRRRCRWIVFVRFQDFKSSDYVRTLRTRRESVVFGK
jgi:hypothetical protein